MEGFRSTKTLMPNPAAPGNGAITLLFHAERLASAVPKQQRSLKLSHL